MLELKKAEHDFEVQMKELDVDVYALKTADIQDARKNFSKDWTARIMGVSTLGGFLGYIFLVTIQQTLGYRRNKAFTYTDHYL